MATIDALLRMLENQTGLFSPLTPFRGQRKMASQLAPAVVAAAGTTGAARERANAMLQTALTQGRFGMAGERMRGEFGLERERLAQEGAQTRAEIAKQAALGTAGIHAGAMTDVARIESDRAYDPSQSIYPGRNTSALGQSLRGERNEYLNEGDTLAKPINPRTEEQKRKDRLFWGGGFNF